MANSPPPRPPASPSATLPPANPSATLPPANPSASKRANHPPLPAPDGGEKKQKHDIGQSNQSTKDTIIYGMPRPRFLDDEYKRFAHSLKIGTGYTIDLMLEARDISLLLNTAASSISELTTCFKHQFTACDKENRSYEMCLANLGTGLFVFQGWIDFAKKNNLMEKPVFVIFYLYPTCWRIEALDYSNLSVPPLEEVQIRIPDGELDVLRISFDEAALLTGRGDWFMSTRVMVVLDKEHSLYNLVLKNDGNRGYSISHDWPQLRNKFNVSAGDIVTFTKYRRTGGLIYHMFHVIVSTMNVGGNAGGLVSLSSTAGGSTTKKGAAEHEDEDLPRDSEGMIHREGGIVQPGDWLVNDSWRAGHSVDTDDPNAQTDFQPGSSYYRDFLADGATDSKLDSDDAADSKLDSDGAADSDAS